MGISRAQVQPVVDAVEEGTRLAEASISKVSDEDIRAAHRGAIATLRRAVESFKGSQLNEVVAGTRPFQKWIDYSNSLLEQAKSYVSGASEIFARLSKVSISVGKVALSLDKVTFEPIRKQIADLDAKRKQIAKSVAAYEAKKKLLVSKRKSLSTETDSLLFGAKWTGAAESWSKFNRLVSGLVTISAQFLGGQITLESDGKGDLSAKPLEGLGAQTLGAVPVVAAGTVIATVSICAALAVSLFAFFKHLDEVTRKDVTVQKLALVKEGKGKEVLALTKLENEAQQSGDENSFSSNMKTLGIALATVAGLAVAVPIIQSAMDRKARAA